MNYMIVTLSKITKSKENFKELTYKSSSGDYYSGKQTNEAPTKYLIDKIAKGGELFDKIIVLVTPECVNDPVPAIDGKGTYEYYVENIKKYIVETINKYDALANLITESYEGESKQYLNSVFSPINTSDDMNRKISDVITQYDDSDVPIQHKVYLDYTGGSRVVSLVSLLLVRILSSLNTEVKEIVYGNILSNPPTIQDCTENYNMLTVIENIVRAEMSGNERTKKLNDALVELGLIDKIDNSLIEAIDNFEAMSKQKLTSQNDISIIKAKKKIEKKANEQTGLGKQLANQAIMRGEKESRLSAFIKLASKPDKELIKDFHSSLMNIFIDKKIIISTKKGKNPSRIIENSIKANDAYYYGEKDKDGKKLTEGVLKIVHNWLNELNNNRNFNPVKHYEVNTKLNNKKYRDWQSPFYLKKINIREIKNFPKYISSNGIKVNETEQHRIFSELSKLQVVYYNFGFPFMCSGVGNDGRTYRDIYEFYHKEVEAFFYSLHELMLKSRSEYSKTLSYYINTEGAVENKIPYMVKMNTWSFNNDIFSGGSGEQFVKEFCDRIERVRPYRNAISHNLNNEFSDLDKQKEIAKEIRQWLKEYENRFSF